MLVKFFLAVKRIKIKKSCREPIRIENTRAVFDDVNDEIHTLRTNITVLLVKVQRILDIKLKQKILLTVVTYG
jgi:hypothetical protein